MYRYLFLTLLCAVILHNHLLAQEKNITVQPVFGIQLWSTYTMGHEVFNEDLGRYEEQGNRLNFALQRSRLGIKGKAFEHLSYNFTAAFDFVGREVHSGTVGGLNNGPWPRARLWHGFLQYKFPGADVAITAGFFHPQISREGITPALRSTSFDKAWSQNYIRRHLIGTGPGRTSGISIGGMTSTQGKVAVSYDAGIFNPVFDQLSANSAGSQSAPLLTSRIAFHFGDPEFASYSSGHKVNYFGERMGITLALTAARSGSTDFWDSNSGVGVDVLANAGDFNFSGEWMRLHRQRGSIETSASAGFARMGYSFDLPRHVLEATVTWVYLRGPLDNEGQRDANQLSAFSGDEDYFEFALHRYLSPDFRISIAYTSRRGDAGDASSGFRGNNFFNEGLVGPIHRGDFAGIGLIFIL